MSELQPDVTLDERDVEIPPTLPVLPLKETVVFPQSMTPLAIGQERSIKLVDDVVAGDRMLALVSVRNEETETPGWDDLYEIGTAAIVHKLIRVPDGTLRILVQGLRRVRLERRVADDPYLVGEFAEVPEVVEESKELEALTRSVQTLFGRIIAAVPYLPEELQIAAANVDDPSALSHLVASTTRLKAGEKQQLLETADVGDRLRAISAILNRELEVIELGTKIQSQVQSEMEKGQREYFLRQQLKAIQEELGEGDEQQAEVNEIRSRLDELDLPEDVRKAADRELSRLEKLPPAAAEYGVIRTYLDWIVTAAVVEDDRGSPRSRGGAQDPRRGPLRPRQGEGADRRVPGGLEAEGRRLRADPLLRRPARRRQDLARPVDRAHARAQVRPHLGRRRPRRGRDPRTPAHVHRRDAGHDHPRPPRRRVEEPGLPDRRDRQDGLRLARRPVERDARGARPRAELDLPRPLPRPAVRPLEGAVHLHRQPAGDDPGAARSTGWT